MGWQDRLGGILNFRLIRPGFDGTKILENYYKTGRFPVTPEIDMAKVRKDLNEFESDSDAIKFLNNEETLGSNGSSGAS